MNANPLPGTTARSRAKVLTSSFIGTTIEWYDFAIFGTAAALFFPQLFFPGQSAFLSVLLSFSTFAVAFIARPLGGVLFGHLGDVIGRKRVLVMTLTLMGVATFGIGLLPSFETVGALAPILLVVLRALQGLSLGGEYSGAILMAVEHAPQPRRGLYGSIVQAGSPMGAILGLSIFLALGNLDEGALLSWGWRIPFLLSAVLVLVALYVRMSLEESPEFEQVKATKDTTRSKPLGTILREHWLKVLLVAGSYISAGITFYIVTVFSLSYGQNDLGIPYNTMVLTLLISHAVTLMAIPFFGSLSDRLGRRGVFLAGIVGMGLMAFPWLQLMETRSFGSMLLGFLLIMLPYSACYGAMATYYAELFPPALRFSGYALGYTLGTILGSAIAPTISASLLEATGTSVSIAIYMAIAALISVVATAYLGRYAQHQQQAVAPVVSDHAS